MPLEEARELDRILQRLAKDYENSVREWATFTGNTPDEAEWLKKTFAKLTSEESVNEFGGGYKLTPIGYSRYAHGISGLPAVEDDSSIPAGLSVALLYEILLELGKLRNLPSSEISSSAFDKLIRQPSLQPNSNERFRYAERHLDFLEVTGLIRIGARLAGIALQKILFRAPGQLFFSFRPSLGEWKGYTATTENLFENQIQSPNISGGRKSEPNS